MGRMGAVTNTRPARFIVPIMLLGLLAVSTAAVLVRMAGKAIPGDSGLGGLTVDDSLAIAFWRITIASAVLAPVWLSAQRRASIAVLPRPQRLRLVGGGLLLGAHFALWLSSLAYTSVASSVLLVTTTPIWVGLLSPWIVGERPGLRTWLGIATALVGSAVVAFEPSSELYPDALLGNLLAIGGALAASGYLMLGRRVRADLGFLGYTAATLASAWLVLAATVVLLGIPIWGYSATVWGLLVLLALLPQLLGHGSLTYVLRWVGADIVAVVLLGEPIGAALLAWLLLAELPEASAFVGGPLLIAGMAIVLTGRLRRRLGQPNRPA